MKKNVTILRVLYPVWAIVGMFSIIYVGNELIALENPSFTASCIIENELLFRSSVVGSLITQLLFIFTAWYLFQLFKEIKRKTAQMMLLLALVSVPMTMLNELGKLAALDHLENPEQMMFFLNMHSNGIIISSIFWGLWLFPLGSLIYRSKMFPKVIGILVMIGGVGYMFGSFISLLAPDNKVIQETLEYLTMGEVIWMLWITIRGANWKNIET